MSLFDQQKWNGKYQNAEGVPALPSAVLVGLADFLPMNGRAIDVAGGAGRNAIWLSQRGLDVTIADVSAIGLQLAAERASVAGVSLTPLQVDLEEEPFPTGPWDLIVSVCYLQRQLFSAYPRVLAPGGLLVVIQPTVTNLEKHDKPPRPFLLEVGELPRLVSGLEIVHYTEEWLDDGRHDAVVVARRPEVR